MKNQAYRMTMLFDFYGEVLTERQKEFYDLYYNEDLSLGEIAENYNITRKRFHTMREQLNSLHADAAQLAELAGRRDDPEMEVLAVKVRDAAEKLLKE